MMVIQVQERFNGRHVYIDGFHMPHGIIDGINDGCGSNVEVSI